MRLAVVAALLLIASSAALAQPGASQPDQAYGPPAPQPQPQPYAPPAPPPQEYPQQQPAPPQQYPEQYPRQQYPQQPARPQQYPQVPQQGYPQQGYPQPYAPYQQQQQPVGGLTRPLVIKKIKDPGTARLLSIGVTGLGFVGMLAGADNNNEELAWASLGLTLIGPSAGHIYAGEGGHALKMTLLRTGGLLTFVWGAVKSVESGCFDCSEPENSEGEVAMYLGGAVVLVSTLYDLYDSSRAATRYNEKAAKALTLGPTMMSSAKGGTSPGVALSGSF